MNDIPTQNLNQPLNNEKDKIEINLKEDNETEEYDLTSKEKDKKKSLDTTTGVVNENIPTPSKEIGSDENNVQRINESCNVYLINDNM